jgi:hypothetical protein
MSPAAHQPTTLHSINSVSSSTNESNTTTAMDQRVASTTSEGDTDMIASVRATGQLIKLSGLVNQYTAVIMVDSGSTSDFISYEYVKLRSLAVKEYKHSKCVWLADGQHHTVNSYVECELQIGELVECIQLGVIPLVDYDVIVGSPWLKRHNPSIDWSTGIVRVSSQGRQCVLPLHTHSHVATIQMVSAIQMKREVQKGRHVSGADTRCRRAY